MPFMFAKAMFWQQQPTQKPMFAFFEVESKTKTELWAFCIVLTRKCLLSIQILCKLINFAVSHSSFVSTTAKEWKLSFCLSFWVFLPTHRAVLRAEWLNGLQSVFGCDSAWKNSSILPLIYYIKTFIRWFNKIRTNLIFGKRLYQKYGKCIYFKSSDYNKNIYLCIPFLFLTAFIVFLNLKYKETNSLLDFCLIYIFHPKQPKRNKE